MMNKAEILDLVFMVLALIFTVVSHELAHGYVALLNGDKTAQRAGRLSFNPIKHLDLMGALFLIVFKFGWAKPVPINERNFKNRRLGLFLVSIAGVSVNLVTSIISILILILVGEKIGVFSILFSYLAIYGLFFCVFNLIPIPPLDGSKVLASFLPEKFQYVIYKYERYFVVLLVAFLAYNSQTGFISKIVLSLRNTIIEILLNILGLI